MTADDTVDHPHATATERAAAPLPDHLHLRKLQEADRDKGFLALLRQLTVVDPVTDHQFSDTFQEISSHTDYYICVIEDTRRERIVACGTMVVERKFIRSCGTAGHIEDVVVDESCRGLRLGQRIVAALLEESERRGCYKAILDCSEDNIGFYQKAGLSVKGVQMAKYF